VQFFRSMGASLGVALFGAIFNNQLSHNMAAVVAQLGPAARSAGGASGALQNPAALHQLPLAIQTLLLHAFASSLDTVFLLAVPVSAIGFVLAWFLPEIPLRRVSPMKMGEAGAAVELALEEEEQDRESVMV